MSGKTQLNTLINPVSILIGKNKLTSIITLTVGILFGIIGLVFNKTYTTIFSAGLLAFSHYMANITLSSYYHLPKTPADKTTMTRKHARPLISMVIGIITTVIISITVLTWEYNINIQQLLFYTIIFTGAIQLIKNWKSIFKWIILTIGVVITAYSQNTILITITALTTLTLLLFEGTDEPHSPKLVPSSIGIFNYIDDSILDVGIIKLIYTTLTLSVIILSITLPAVFIIYFGKTESLLNIINTDVSTLITTYTKLPKNTLDISNLPVWAYFIITISLFYAGKNTIELITSKIFYKQLTVDNTKTVTLPGKDYVKNIIQSWQGEPVKIIIHQYDPQNPIITITSIESINGTHLLENWWEIISIHSYHYTNNKPDNIIIIDNKLKTSFIKLKLN